MGSLVVDVEVWVGFLHIQFNNTENIILSKKDWFGCFYLFAASTSLQNEALLFFFISIFSNTEQWNKLRY